MQHATYGMVSFEMTFCDC